ncbi:MAG: PP2C family serine/threonine-protein phosphatase [Methanoregula sp.]|nr:PP2C family serine/threonine-protein phosphatase [Methanoregula sp.]
MRWKFTHASVTGKGHTDRGEPGQDFCKAGTVRFSDAEFFIGIAADGAGSTTDGGRGAEIACSTCYAQILETLRSAGELARITDEDVRNWLTVSREAIVIEAQEHVKRVREYACTILGVISGHDRAIYFQIGDGAIVAGTGPDYQTIFWPEQGEYANTTFFITDEQFLDRLHVHHDISPDEVAVFTDGLQNLVLSFAKRTAHAGFFVPLFGALRKDPENGFSDFSAQLAGFLSRHDISARSDDDKTLILALRIDG